MTESTPTHEQDKLHAPAVLSADEHNTEEDEIPHLPDPSIWPIIVALGIATLTTGIVINLTVIIIGLVIFVFGLGGWIFQDIQAARRGEHH